MNIGAWPLGYHVYRIFDRDERLIYVGASRNLTQRLIYHRSQAWWYTLAHRLEAEPMPNEQEALRIETAAILSERPAFNIVHRKGRVGPYLCRLTEADVETCREWLRHKKDGAGYLPVGLYWISAEVRAERAAKAVPA